jgi:hypothetical protein
MISREEARQLALALPEAVEQDHHGRPSFRVGDKIFATQWDEHHMNEVWWGMRLAAVRVDLRRVAAEALADLLADAWERKAPRRLLHDR